MSFRFFNGRALSRAAFVVVLCLFGSFGLKAQFVAFNDHAPGAGTSPNATTYDIFGNGAGLTGPLKDSKTGAVLPVVLTISVTDAGVAPASTQGSPAAGTPLYNAFNGFVDFQGTPNPSVELTEGGLVTYTFTGLNPNKRYSFMGSAVRGNAGYTDRWTLFEIAGAGSFTSAHTAHVLTSAQTQDVSPAQGAINTGINHRADTGDMVVWENIDPGAEGSFAVTCQQYTGAVPNGVSTGVKGYGMTGIRLEEFDAAKAAVAITNQPSGATVDEAHPVSFTVGVTGNPAPTFQWFKNGTEIQNATNATYSIASAQLSDDGAIFKVVASNAFGGNSYTATSSDVVLHVNADTTAPTLVSVEAVGLNQVRVVFSEGVTGTGADASNYSITSGAKGLNVNGASLDASGMVALLDVDPLTENIVYTLTVSGVRDLSGGANEISASKTFSAVTYAPLDIGLPLPPLAGGIKAVAGGYDVTGSGVDIGAAKDQFQFASQQRAGDFDMRVRVADLGITDPFVKAGLMAREGLGATNRFAAVFASSAQVGEMFEYRSANAGAAVSVQPPIKFPANYPWAWLRLQRVGNDFTGYGSFDGKAWQAIGKTTLASMSNQVYFGMAVTSGNTNALTTAKFRQIEPTPFYVTSFTYRPTHEAIGPSNRRTGIIFSEIMYRPKARTDGKVLDFVEIYNGEAIFIDLTGWRIGGGIDFAFPDGFKIQAGQFVVIAKDPAAVQEVYGISGVVGPFQKTLSDSSDTLKLFNASGALRAEVTYSSEAPWPVAADGTGHSLVCANPSYGENDPRAWAASAVAGGSPGYDDPIVPNAWAGVSINEVLAVPAAGGNGFVELFNASTNAVDLAGCFLTDSATTNKFRIPEGVSLAPHDWISFMPSQMQFGFASAGGTIYLVSADESRVLDAVRYGGQEQGVSVGRAPEGSPTFRRLASPTMGAANSKWRQEAVVINELMYKPISDDADDQYVELFNRSGQAVSLEGWRFTDGIDFSFPAGATLPANGYLVVARNLSRLMTNYAQLNVNNAVGNFDGKLKGGEHIALAKPGMHANEFVVVCEFNYGTGGRWPELANGGGSSMELKDAHADPWQASSWAASDETQKATWDTYTYTATYDNSAGSQPLNRFYVMCQGEGEYLLDDIEVNRSGTNMLSNAGFENGTGGWSFFGTHSTTTVQAGGAATGNNSLHVRCSEVGDEGPNSIRGTLTAAVTAGNSITIRTKARWLQGWPEMLLRIRGNGVEFPLKFKIPKNLGTPGLANSRVVANAGPTISEVTHYPPLPRANDAVVVSARVGDADGIGAVQLAFRVDPGTATNFVAMTDDGTGGDLVAGDGIYSATIPARASGQIAFKVRATDTPGVTALFPADAHEGLVRWADPIPFGSIGHYHLWSSSAAPKNGQDRTYTDCTIVYDLREIYNAGWRNKGSPFHSGVGSYSVGFPDDDLFLAADKHVFRSSGNGGDEATEMADDVSYWVAEKMGSPFNHARYIRLYRNGTLHYRIDYDLEVPDRGIAKDWFGGGGLNDTLYKIAGWFEYDDSNSSGGGGVKWADITKKPTSGPPFKLGAYRFNFQPHPGGLTANDYSLIFNIVAAANNTADRVTQLMNVADMEQWMRVLAFRRTVGDWDSWSYQTGQNMYLYAPLGERARLMNWDVDFVFGQGNGVGTSFFSAGEDSVVSSLMSVPAYRRMMWRAYIDAANGPLTKAMSDPQFDSRQSMLTKNAVGASAPTAWKGFVSSQRNTILSQAAAADAKNFTITTPDSTNSTPTATITGVAPFGVATIEINGIPYPVKWTGFTTWSVNVPLGADQNVLNVVGKDLRGNVYTNATKTVTITYTGAVPQAADWVVINEIMYNASVSNAEFIEFYNSHPTYAFDLSGYQLKGADFTFAPGTIIQTNGYLVVAKDSASFAGAYGATIPIAGEYAGKLQNSGETLSLVKPGATSAQDVVIDSVHYENVFPWPTLANGFGPSLQRIDPVQDSWRPANWAATAVDNVNRATPGRTNVTKAALDPFPAIWINEVLASNVAGGVDGQGEHEPWIELYNSGTDVVDLSLFYLSNDPLNPIAWQFPTGTTLAPGAFMVVWADGQPEQTTAGELHASFRLAASGGVVALSRMQAGGPGVIDYIYYPASGADQSYGSIRQGDGENRRFLFSATPGAPNDPGNLLVPVSINEWMASNSKIIQDPADGDYDDWFELYNRGASAIDLSGYYLSNSATNATKFKIPDGYGIAPHGFLLVWADQETTQNAPTRVDLHVNFKLSKDGDEIALFAPDGQLIDSISFGLQADNVASGRYPDGAPGLYVLTTASPRAANSAPPGTRFMQVSTDGAQLTVVWLTAPGRTYRVEYKSAIDAPVWTTVGNSLTATGSTLSASVALDQIANGFFRIVQLN